MQTILRPYLLLILLLVTAPIVHASVHHVGDGHNFEQVSDCWYCSMDTPATPEEIATVSQVAVLHADYTSALPEPRTVALTPYFSRAPPLS